MRWTVHGGDDFGRAIAEIRVQRRLTKAEPSRSWRLPRTRPSNKPLPQ